MRTCLSSRDGRPEVQMKGLKIKDEPCVWCGGVPCTFGSTALCEPQDYLRHGEGVAFHMFNARSFMEVAKCKDGRPDLPPELPAVNAKAGVLRVQICGEMVYTVPHIMNDYGNCKNFCEGKASNSYLSGKLNWTCEQAWIADGNTCHPIRGTMCTQDFKDFMAVGLCRCKLVPEALTDKLVLAGGQCGGFGWTGATECVDGYICARRNATYSECVPETSDCYEPCGSQGGLCAWCGAGRACCRQGLATDPAVCKGITSYSTWHHECVALPTTSLISVVTDTTTANGTNTSGVPVEPEPSGMGNWLWLLPLALVACCLILGLLYFCLSSDDRDKRRRQRIKRGMEVDDATSVSESRDTESESSGPENGGPDLFDLIDRNHDGIVTEEEFAAAMGGYMETRSPGMSFTMVQPMQVVQPVQLVQTVQTMTATPVVTTATPLVTTVASPLATQVVRPPTPVTSQIGTAIAIAPPVGRTLSNTFTTQLRETVTDTVTVTRGAPVVATQEASLFDLIDKNHDGTISMSEWKRAMSQAPEEPLTRGSPSVDLYTIRPMGR